MCLTKRVEEYEKEHSNFEPAGQYLKSALDASRSATQKLKTQGQDLSERSVPMAIDGIHKVRDSLDELQQQAIKYDDKYTGSHGQHAVDALQHWVNSGRQRATDAMEMTNELLMKLRDAIGNVAGQASHGAQVAVGETVRAAEFGDEKLGVSSNAGGVVQKVRELDARLGVTATAAKVDTKITGGLGCKVASTTVDMVTESVTYISETLHNAKLAAQHSETAQSAEAKGATVAGAAAAKKNEVQSTFNEAVDVAKEKTGMATEKTQKKAEEAKEMAKDKAEMTKDKACEATDMTKDKAQQTKEAAKDHAGTVKDKTKEQSKGVVDQAMDKAGELKDKGKEQLATVKSKMESKTMKPKEPATAQEETTTEKLLGGAKQTGAKASEAAKTAAGTAKKHGKHAKEAVSDDTSGFQHAQQHVKKSSK
ncbi:hypothetical protein P3T76_015903 [Phytophthora citrophthora]|uniref:Uncharacterized protein n=1 Tax=Phytophthora citrophthora TaxID=4793 RepID=A0AAD9FZ12_9STRA|nr:hypothetical protein P3T76_015903 [Phytophthora citrophthora]